MIVINKNAVYKISNQLGLANGDIDYILSNKLEKCSNYNLTIMTSSADLYKAGTHYGTVGIKDFKKD